MYNIEEVFKNVSSKMIAEFLEARSAVSHSTIKGDNSEKIFKRFLRKYLPKNLEITSGIIIDSKGNSSKQIDIIITDSHSTPILFEGDDSQVVPVEPVYAAVEVKSILDSSMLPSIINNMLSVKNLEKKAYYKPLGESEHYFILYNKRYEIAPIMYFFFAFEAKNEGMLVNDFIREFQKRNLDISKRIDCGCILNNSVYANCGSGNKFLIDALPYEDSILMPIKTKHALLLFYTLISHYLNQSRCPRFRFNDYINKIKLW